jgi:hypothetical protein
MVEQLQQEKVAKVGIVPQGKAICDTLYLPIALPGLMEKLLPYPG